MADSDMGGSEEREKKAAPKKKLKRDKDRANVKLRLIKGKKVDHDEPRERSAKAERSKRQSEIKQRMRRIQRIRRKRLASHPKIINLTFAKAALVFGVLAGWIAYLLPAYQPKALLIAVCAALLVYLGLVIVTFFRESRQKALKLAVFLTAVVLLIILVYSFLFGS